MSYQRSTQGDCQREIEYFSSPTLNYRGTPTGDAARRDNRRVLLETARRVANYRQSGNTGGGTHLLPYILAENTAGAHGFVRIVNRSAQAGTVTLTAIDDAGRNAGTETLSLAANGAIHFTSRDLERGNADKGLSGVGPGIGHWRLVLTSSLDIQPLAYVRTTDGSFLTRIDDIEAEVEGSGNRYIVHFFNPGSARKKVSYLRLINPGSADTVVSISAHDDQGRNRGPVSFSLPAGHARHVTVSELETGEGLDGRLGTGSGKWRLTVTATQPVQVMSLLQTPTGHLTNLSGVPAMTDTVTPPPPPPPTGYWGAIAAGWSEYCVYVGWNSSRNHRDRDSATSRAVSACRARGLDGCRLVVAFQQCGALASGASGSRCDLIGGSGASRAAAERDALSRCQADYSLCRVRVNGSDGRRASYCNGATALTMPHAEAQSGSGTTDVPPGTPDSGPLLIPNRDLRPVEER